MARVYKAALPAIGKIAAVKRLEPHPSLEAVLGKDRLEELFLKEARTMAGLRHPNLLPVLDFDTAGGRPFYVMEFHAVNLGDVIGETYRPDQTSRILRLDQAVEYVFQVLDGLARLHFAEVIHRDIKPFNLLIEDTERVCIGDFGLSKLRGEPLAAPGNLKVGSPYYAAPEQETDPDAVGPEADLFSVGVMLRRMLTGRLTGASKPPSRLNPDLTPDWDAFLEKAAAPGPADRFSSASAMKTALASLYEKWQERQEGVCRLPIRQKPRRGPEAGRLSCRRVPVKARPAAARRLFCLDRLWRPERIVANRFAPEMDTVWDEATALLWERSGSPYPSSWQEARRRIEVLNRGRFAGRKDWRLPTVDELTTLLSQTPHGADFCIDPVFDTTQRRLWSCDRCTFTSAWYADARLGYVHRQDFDAPFHCRAVCG